MLQAVVEVEFTRLETLPDLAVQPELVAVSVQAGWFTVGVEGQQVRPQAFRKKSPRATRRVAVATAAAAWQNTFGPGQRGKPWTVWIGAGEVERNVQWTKMAAHAVGQPVHRLPLQGQLARRLHAHTLRRGLQRIARHDLVGALPHSPKGVDRPRYHQRRVTAGGLPAAFPADGAPARRQRIVWHQRCFRPPTASCGTPSHRPGCRRAAGSVPRHSTAGRVGSDRPSDCAGRGRCRSLPGSRSTAGSAARRRV